MSKGASLGGTKCSSHLFASGSVPIEPHAEPGCTVPRGLLEGFSIIIMRPQVWCENCEVIRDKDYICLILPFPVEELVKVLCVLACIFIFFVFSYI